jgi:IS1 family transposase
MRRIALPISLLLYATVLHSQTETFPEPRGHASLIYHPPSKALLFIGGFSVVPDSIQSDVWKLNGLEWSRVPASGPGSRSFFQGTLNAKTGEIQHFGGIKIGRPDDFRGDLWSFDGLKWSMKTIDSIGIRHHHKMVYADHLDAFVLYGGFGLDNKADTTTWIMRNGKFTPMHIPGPGIRYQSGLAYDKFRKRLILYGGGDQPDEHWEFDGEVWEKITRPVSPGIKFHHHMVYDDNLKATILHGGWVNLNSRDPRNFETPVTWLWDGVTWKKIAEEKVFPMALAYDAQRKSVIAYGYDQGNPDESQNLELWELKNKKWSKIADYGKWSTVQYLEKRLKNTPGDFNTLLVYANNLKLINRLTEAERVYKKISDTFPQNIEIISGLVDVLLMQGKTRELEEYISRIEMPNQTKRGLFVRVATNMYNAKEFNAAAAYYEKALSIEKKASEFYNLGCVYTLMNEMDKAFTTLNQAISHGYFEVKQFESDPDLIPLKSDPRWNTLLKGLK